MISEFGSVTYRPGSDPTGWIPYWEATSSDELAEQYADLVEALLDCPNIAGFCYTQLADTAPGRNGMVNQDQVPKVDPERIRAVTGRPSAALGSAALAGRRRREARTP